MGTVVNPGHDDVLGTIDALRARGATHVVVAEGDRRIEVDFPAAAPIVVAEGAMDRLVAPTPLGVPLPVKQKSKSEKEEEADYEAVLLGSARP